jgi:GGDEF domain-containing protein
MTDHVIPLNAPRVPLRSAAQTDGVAPDGLPPHTPLGPVIDRHLTACRRSGAPLVALSIVIDGLESAGEWYGEAVKNQLRNAVWDRFRRRLRATDLTVCIGGVEFGAILLNVGAPVAAVVDARLSKALSQPYGIGGLEIVLSVRIGAAIYPQAGSTGAALAAAALENAVGRQ